MYVLGMLQKENDSGFLQAVWCKQPGGCTLAELGKESCRALTTAAARKHGGEPSDYRVVGSVQYYEHPEVADLIARSMEGVGKQEQEERDADPGGMTP